MFAFSLLFLYGFVSGLFQINDSENQLNAAAMLFITFPTNLMLIFSTIIAFNLINYKVSFAIDPSNKINQMLVYSGFLLGINLTLEILFLSIFTFADKKWIIAIIVLIIFIILITFLIKKIISYYRYVKGIKYIKKHGTKIICIITDFLSHESSDVDGESNIMYWIRCVGENNGMKQSFLSDKFFYPVEKICTKFNIKNVDVYVNPEISLDYLVDLSSIEKYIK